MRHSLIAGGISAGLTAVALNNIGDILLKAGVSIVVGVCTWFITQMIKKVLDKRNHDKRCPKCNSDLSDS